MPGADRRIIGAINYGPPITVDGHLLWKILRHLEGKKVNILIEVVQTSEKKEVQS